MQTGDFLIQTRSGKSRVIERTKDLTIANEKLINEMSKKEASKGITSN